MCRKLTAVLTCKHLGDIASDSGHQSASFSTGFIVLGLLTSEFILMLRTYAIWDRNRKALYVLLATGTVRTFQTSGILYLTFPFSLYRF